MAKQLGGGSGGMAAQTDIHQKGMRDRAAEPVDKSMGLGKGSVNNDATRSSTAPTPKTLGERCA